MKMNNNFKIFLLIIFSQYNIANAQIGEYCTEKFLWSKCYKLLPDNKFESEELLCVAQITGKGYFEITEDSIRFNYEPIDFFENQFRIEKDEQIISESVQIKFQIRDYESQNMIDSVYISCLSEIDHQKQDLNSLEVSSTKFPILIEIYAEGYSLYRFQIFQNGFYTVNLNLMHNIFRDSYEPATGTESFKIIGEIGKTVILSNDIYTDNLEFKRSGTQPNKL
jgi:hypothetical protein